MKLLSAVLLVVSLSATLSGCTYFEKWFGDEDKAAVASAEKPVRKKSPAKIDPRQFSGYLGDYSKMQEFPTPSGGTRLAWLSPELKKGQYHSIIIDSVGFYPRPPLYSKVSKGRMLEVVQYLHKQARQQIGRDLKIVSQPGPGVLRWDAAITGVPATDAGNSESRNLPVAGIFADASPTAIPAEHGLVVFLESRLVDTQTQKTVAKSVRAGLGSVMADPKARITMKEMQPVLDGWVSDAGIFVREHIK